ncbi:MAG: alpha/beta hydrolase [Thermodesulfobacteriota bacterium]
MDSPQVCRVNDHNLTYFRAGQGETVLLVHGITTYSFLWQDIFPELAKNYDVIAFDLLGCGASDMPLDVSYSLSAHAERLKIFVDQLSIDRLHLVGHDLGGGIAQIFAVNHPDMLYDLTLINSVGYDFWPVQPITALRTPIIRQILMATMDIGAFKILISRGTFHKELVTEELMEQFYLPLQSSLGRKAFMHFARCLDNHNLTEITEELKQLKLPVLIIRGDADPYLSAEIAERLHEDIPGSRLVRVAEASHFIQVDDPERVNRELLNFLARD